MSESEKELLKVSGKMIRNAEWILVIYQRDGDKVPTFKLIHSPNFYQMRTQFRDKRMK